MARYLSIAFAAFAIFLISLFGYALTVGPNDIQRNAVLGKHIKKNAVKSADIAKGAVKSSDIRNGGIKTKDMADGAVTGAKIADGTVTGADVSDGSIDTADLTNEAVNNTKIATGAVDTPELADNAVTKMKLSSDVTVHGLSGVALVGVAGFGIDAPDENCFFENDGYWKLQQTTTDLCCLHAPVYLPHDVRITGFEGMFLDSDPGELAITTIEFERKDIRDTSGNLGLATLVTSDTNMAFQTIRDLTLDHVVDAVNKHYYVGVCVKTEHQRFYGARVYYEPKS